MHNSTTVRYPVQGTLFEAELRGTLRALQYTPAAIADALAFVEQHGTFTGCESIEPEDLDAANALFFRHAAFIVCDPSEWPPIFDEDVWNTNEIEPFEPSMADRVWVSSHGTVNPDGMIRSKCVNILAEGASIPAEVLARTMAGNTATDADGVIDALMDLSFPGPGGYVPGRGHVSRPVTDRDMARFGAVG